MPVLSNKTLTHRSKGTQKSSTIGQQHPGFQIRFWLGTILSVSNYRDQMYCAMNISIRMLPVTGFEVKVEKSRGVSTVKRAKRRWRQAEAFATRSYRDYRESWPIWMAHLIAATRLEKDNPSPWPSKTLIYSPRLRLTIPTSKWRHTRMALTTRLPER